MNDEEIINSVKASTLKQWHVRVWTIEADTILDSWEGTKADAEEELETALSDSDFPREEHEWEITNEINYEASIDRILKKLIKKASLKAFRDGREEVFQKLGDRKTEIQDVNDYKWKTVVMWEDIEKLKSSDFKSGERGSSDSGCKKQNAPAKRPDVVFPVKEKLDLSKMKR